MIDKLRQAIEQQNWDLVVEFYEELIGAPRKVAAPTPARTVVRKPTPDRPKNGLEDFTMRPVVGNTKTRATAETPPAEPPKPKKTRKSKQGVKASKIQFVDTGEKVDEAGADLINDQVPLTPRKRKPFKPIKMTCVTCKAVDEVSPIFKRDAEVYKCNSCLSKGRINGPE